MKKVIFSLFSLVFISHIGFGQLDSPNYLGKSLHLNPEQSVLSFTGNYYIASNSLNGNFNNAIYNGKYITDKIKNSVELKGDNIFGSASNFSFTYSFKPSKDTLKNNSISYLFGISDKRYSNLAFSDDYFNLLFYGNSNLPEANLDGFNMNLLTYQKIFAGITKKFESENYYHSLYAGIALLKGQQAYSIDIMEGFVNTSEFGEEINAGINYTYHSSDTSKFGLMDWNGTGVSADIEFSSFNKKKLRGYYIGVYNIGAIFWNQESLNVSADTSFSYNGEEIADFMDFTSTDFSGLNEDSILNDFYYDKSGKGKFTTRTPMQISFNFHQYIKLLRTTFSVGAKHLLFANMRVPYYYLTATTPISQSFRGTIQLANGGFGRFQVGLGCHFNVKQKFMLSLFTQNVQGFLHNENTYNQGAYVSASYKF